MQMIGLAVVLALGLVIAPLAVEAQQTRRVTKVPRVGMIGSNTLTVARPALLEEFREHGWVDGQNITIEWREAEGKPERIPAKLPRFRLYDLRHTFGTHLLEAGASITYVAAQLGHSNPATTLRHYAHWIPRGDWIDRLVEARNAASGSKLVVATAQVRGASDP